MLFQSLSLLAIMACSALAAPTSPQAYNVATTTTITNAPATTPVIPAAYSSAVDSYTVIVTLHTDVFRWTAALNETRDAYAACTTDKDRAVYKKQLKTQFNSLQTCLESAQAVIKKQSKHSNDPRLVNPVQDCVQEIRYTGEGLIPVLGKDVVAPLLRTVVKTVNGLLGALLPLVGGLLGLVYNLVGGLLDILF